MALGDEVKRRRLELGLNRHELAAKCGVTNRWIEQLESGMKFAQTPPPMLLEQLAQALERTVDTLTGVESPPAELYRTVLMNAAMMPIDGVYVRKEIGKAEFISHIRAAHRSGLLKSYIGYKQTAEHIKSISGVTVEICRQNTHFTMYDNIVVCKLRRRVLDKRYIPETQKKDSYQYLHIHFKGKKDVYDV